MLLWQDYEYTRSLSWEDLLRMFEKGMVRVTRPANAGYSNPNFDFKFNLGVLMTSANKILHPLQNDEKQKMMDRRFRFFYITKSLEHVRRAAIA